VTEWEWMEFQPPRGKEEEKRPYMAKTVWLSKTSAEPYLLLVSGKPKVSIFRPLNFCPSAPPLGLWIRKWLVFFVRICCDNAQPRVSFQLFKSLLGGVKSKQRGMLCLDRFLMPSIVFHRWNHHIEQPYSYVQFWFSIVTQPHVETSKWSPGSASDLKGVNAGIFQKTAPKSIHGHNNLLQN
jgi:hypothetical protein